MLMLTDNATSVIRALVDAPQMPDAAGLRIASTQGAAEGLSVSTTTTPEPEDQVVEEQGARVYLEPTAAAILEDKVLDASVDADGEVRFHLAVQ